MSKKLKIIFVAVFNPTSTNVSQADGFRKNNCEVIEVDYRFTASKVGNKDRDKILVELCKNHRPDGIIFSKCNEVPSWVIDECNKYTKTILWYMDPFNGNFNESLRQKIKLCHKTFCALQEPFKRAKEIGGNKVHFLQEGYDHNLNYPINIPYKYDYTFIGNPRGWRTEYVNKLNIPVIQNAYGEDHSKVVSETKVNLNFTEGGTSDRTYKILASKGFLLTEPWEGMENDFKIGRDLDIFINVEDLKNKINYYLNNCNERKNIAEHGYNTVQKFSRVNWAKKILEEI